MSETTRFRHLCLAVTNEEGKEYVMTPDLGRCPLPGPVPRPPSQSLAGYIPGDEAPAAELIGARDWRSRYGRGWIAKTDQDAAYIRDRMKEELGE
jgi:hypothetical protein